jgi:hypothetical protein
MNDLLRSLQTCYMLLSRLLSGEIRIKDAEKFIGEMA